MTEGLRQDKGPLILAENAVKDAAIESTRRCSHFRFLIKTFIKGWLHGQITLALISEFTDFFLYSIRPRNHTSFRTNEKQKDVEVSNPDAIT